MPPPAPPRIRLATPADAGTLALLRYEFRVALDPADEVPEAFVARCASWMRARLIAPAPWSCWIAESSGQLAGMAWLMILEKLPNPAAEPEQHGYVSSLYVKPEHRGRGLGSDLLRTCLRAGEAQRCDAIFLWPTARSRSLYLRHGFAVRQDLLELRIGPAPAH
jgi:ribosomal protein S18 acetylase RimI-like enzyme